MLEHHGAIIVYSHTDRCNSRVMNHTHTSPIHYMTYTSITPCRRVVSTEWKPPWWNTIWCYHSHTDRCNSRVMNHTHTSPIHYMTYTSITPCRRVVSTEWKPPWWNTIWCYHSHTDR